MFVRLPSYTITAEKMAEPLQTVPMSVSAVTSNEIDQFNLFNFSDIAELAPGLDMNTTDPRNPIPSIRGVSYNPDSGTTSAVDIYFNETAIDAQTAFQGLYDLGQIEVLRGPQGTLRGRSSPGGAITIATHLPDLSSAGASVQQSYGSLGLVNTQAAVNIPIVSGKLAVRLAGLYDSDDVDEVTNIIRQESNRSHTRSGRASLLWSPSDNFDLSIVSQVLHEKSYIAQGLTGHETYNSGLPAYLSPYSRISLDPADSEYANSAKVTTVTGDLKLPANNRLTFIIGLQETTNYLDQGNVNVADLIPAFPADQTLDTTTRRQTYEVRIGSTDAGFWSYMFGGYYERSYSSGEVNQPAAELWINPSATPPYYSVSSVSTSPVPVTPGVVVPLDLMFSGPTYYRGLFTNQTLRFSKQWKLEIGARWQQIWSTNFQSDSALGIASGTGFAGKPLTGGASLSYQLDPTFMLYATYGRSYRPGGTTLRTDPLEFQKYLQFAAETSNSIELGEKANFLDNLVQLNADVFYQKFKNYIGFSGYVPATNLLDGNEENVYGITFNGDAEIKGIELNASYSLPYRFVLGLDASYDDARWDGAQSPITLLNPQTGAPIFNTPGQQVSYGILNGRLSDTPSLTTSVRLEWSRKVSTSGIEVFSRGLWTYTGNKMEEAAIMPNLGGYGRVDLFAGVRSHDQKWELSLWVKNLFNREAILGDGVPETLGGFTSGYYQVNLLQKRQFGVTGSYRY